MILKKPKEKQPTPTHGDYKFVKRFAWFPKELSNGTLVWLMHYKEVWEYKVRLRYYRYIKLYLRIGDWDLIHTKLYNEKHNNCS